MWALGRWELKGVDGGAWGVFIGEALDPWACTGGAYGVCLLHVHNIDYTSLACRGCPGSPQRTLYAMVA